MEKTKKAGFILALISAIAMLFGGISLTFGAKALNQNSHINNTVSAGLIESLGNNQEAINGIVYHSASGNAVIDGYLSTLTGNVVIPSSVTLGGVDKPVTTIMEGAFRGCTAITGVTIPSSVTLIDSNAFRDCTGLVTLSLSRNSGIGNSDSNVFAGCTGISSITFGANVVYDENDFYSFDAGCFASCANLAEITVDANNEYLKSEGNCLLTKDGSKLLLGSTASIIPDSVTTIGQYAFKGRSGLLAISLPSSLETIESGAFYDCSGFTTISVPDSVENMGSSAFFGCTGLKNLSIGSGVTQDIDDAFSSFNLEHIEVDEDNEAYCSVGNCILTKDGKELVLGCKTSVIPNTVESIGHRAFYWCIGMTRIVIPDNVQSIGSEAFAGCEDLTYVELPKWIEVGQDIFIGSGVIEIHLNGPVSLSSRSFYHDLEGNEVFNIYIDAVLDDFGEAQFSGDIATVIVEQMMGDAALSEEGIQAVATSLETEGSSDHTAEQKYNAVYNAILTAAGMDAQSLGEEEAAQVMNMAAQMVITYEALLTYESDGLDGMIQYIMNAGVTDNATDAEAMANSLIQTFYPSKETAASDLFNNLKTAITHDDQSIMKTKIYFDSSLTPYYEAVFGEVDSEYVSYDSTYQVLNDDTEDDLENTGLAFDLSVAIGTMILLCTLLVVVSKRKEQN